MPNSHSSVFETFDFAKLIDNFCMKKVGLSCLGLEIFAENNHISLVLQTRKRNFKNLS